MNRREVIYADIHVQSTESCKFGTLLDDNRVEYAKLNHSIKVTKKMDAPPKQDEVTSNSEKFNSNYNY